MRRSIPHVFCDKRQLSVVMMVVVIPMPLMMLGGCAWMERVRIRNATGKQVSVTSAHTQKTVRIPNQEAAIIPHSRGDITVVTPNGKTWVYHNVAPQDLAGTPFACKQRYFFFGYQDGYFFRGATTANLLLKDDGRLYAVLEQPKGFPIKPEESPGPTARGP
jgi:hypothetical protein